MCCIHLPNKFGDWLISVYEYSSVVQSQNTFKYLVWVGWSNFESQRNWLSLSLTPNRPRKEEDKYTFISFLCHIKTVMQENVVGNTSCIKRNLFNARRLKHLTEYLIVAVLSFFWLLLVPKVNPSARFLKACRRGTAL
jgi:hypothetical protein